MASRDGQHRHERADEGIVVTFGSSTRDAIAFAETNAIRHEYQVSTKAARTVAVGGDSCQQWLSKDDHLDCVVNANGFCFHQLTVNARQ